LEAKSIDDCLELLDLLMVTELLGKAERETVRERARPGARRCRGFLASRGRNRARRGRRGTS
jgi:hypothetical protein